jgi:hypothetical protein
MHYNHLISRMIWLWFTSDDKISFKIQISTYVYSITIQVLLPEFDLLLLWLFSLMSEFSGVSGICLDGVFGWVMALSWRIPHHICSAVWGFATLSLSCRDPCWSSLKVSILLSDLNQNWNMLTDLNKIPQYQILKFVKLFKSCYI